MFRLLALFVLIAIASAFKNEAECGERPFFKNSKIVNGNQSIEFDWGWQVLLLNNYNFFCGGVLVNQRWVLTAAHCTTQFTTNSSSSLSGLEALTGVHNRNLLFSSNVQRFGVSTVYRHPGFNGNSLINDIAILKLSSPATYDNYTIPACLPDGKETYENEFAWATGWGRFSFNGASPVTLYQSYIKINATKECERNYNLYTFNSATQLCTAKDGPCRGDSGGPLSYYNANTKKHEAIGLVSWGIDCGLGAVFTRVNAFRSWWENIIDNY